jgi:hypothetical protein
MRKRIIVVGAGPAGMMAAISAAESGAQVMLLEKNPSPGRKLLLTGKGRCNLTNTGRLEEVLERFSGRADFLRDAFGVFFNKDLMSFFESRGVRLKTERQGRVFPADDRSGSIVKALQQAVKSAGARFIGRSELSRICFSNGRATGIDLRSGHHIDCDALILATGGVSYAFTGSTGTGIRLAEQLGHRIVALRPGLVPVKTKQDFKLPQGLTLKNIRMRFIADKKEIRTEIGEVLFSDTGITGPLVFTHSGVIGDWIAAGRRVFAEIDFKPGLSWEQADARLLREIQSGPRKIVRTMLKELVPLRMVDIFLARSGINDRQQVNQMTASGRRALVELLKRFRIEITSLLPIEEAMVTRGGVSTRDINPRTMESRIVKGLFFSGEMIDVDADTGGFNLQAAFSTGYLAGRSAAQS